ncbi:FAD-dependent oxidoreductase [Pontibacillus salipaludis]|uniref:FAD-dependent oxidoreductase n=1 Tax=Pontibacillus salipaludis TaxID=1697394 RepID=UPI0031ECD522
MYKLIVIGGGVQGSTIATWLLRFNRIKEEDLLVIDPYDDPMHKWMTTTRKIGMTYLRSPSVHHLDPDPYSLKKYAKEKDYTQGFRGYYNRPQLQMFNNHCKDIFQTVGLQNCWKQGWVRALRFHDERWHVKLSSNEWYQAENVVVAIGVNHQPFIPEWAESLREAVPQSITHVFQENEESADMDSDAAVVVGGGLSAAHMAATLAQKAIEPVTLIKRHPFRIEDFDSDPGWMGPKYLDSYHKESSYQKRRQWIQQARHRGSVTKSMYTKLRSLEQQSKLTIVTDEVEGAHHDDGNIFLRMKNTNQIIANHLFLATGAKAGLPGESWLSATIKEHHLPCAPCGFPIVDQQLKWSKGLYVSGALAELEVGPVSRNIAGARKAAERICKAFPVLEVSR